MYLQINWDAGKCPLLRGCPSLMQRIDLRWVYRPGSVGPGGEVVCALGS